jgi:hypothetical protein
MVKTIGQLSKGANKRTLAGPRRAGGQFEPGTKIGSGESLGAQTGKGNYAGQTSVAPTESGIAPEYNPHVTVDEEGNFHLTPEAAQKFEKQAQAASEGHNFRAATEAQSRTAAEQAYQAYRAELKSMGMSDAELDAYVAKVKAGYGNNGFDRPQVFQGAPEKLRDSSGEIVEIPCAGGDLHRVRVSLQQQVEDAQAAVEMATTTTNKKKTMAALQSAQRLRNVMDAETDGDKLKREIKKLLNHAVGKGWIPGSSYNEQDVEDMFAEANLWELGKQSLKEGMEKNALPQTPETVEQLEALTSEELKHSGEMQKVSSFGARYAVLKWKRENKKYFEDKTGSYDRDDRDRKKILEEAQEFDQKTEASKYAPTRYLNVEALRSRILEVIPLKDYRWLAWYEATSGEGHLPKERKRAERIRRRLKDAGIGQNGDMSQRLYIE